MDVFAMNVFTKDGVGVFLEDGAAKQYIKVSRFTPLDQQGFP